jgi:DNA-binding NarL/FixJ family response regulator
MANGPSILLIDNQELVRLGIRHLLEANDFAVLAAVAHAEAVQTAAELKPDVIILDPDTGDAAGLDIISNLMEASAQSRILVLTSQRDPAVCMRSIMLGAVGIMYKHEPPAVLFKAIGRLQAGEVWLDRGKTAGVLTQLALRRKELDSGEAKIQTLTKREREIVSAVCEGLRNKDISDRLFISEATARNHLTSILDKLGLTSRFDLVVFAFRHGLMKEPAMKQR